MAGFFDSAQNTLASGLSVFFAELYEVNFSSGWHYYWDGFGDLTAYGNTYFGRGQFVARSEIPFGINDEAGVMTLTMSGVDDTLIAGVRVNESEFFGQPILIWGQFFNEALQLEGGRFVLFQGTMDVPTYGGQAGKRSISIPCEGEWANRNGAQFEFFSDSSQQRRFPGDLGLEYVHRYNAGVKRAWPVFPSEGMTDDLARSRPFVSVPQRSGGNPV